MGNASGQRQEHHNSCSKALQGRDPEQVLWRTRGEPSRFFIRHQNWKQPENMTSFRAPDNNEGILLHCMLCYLWCSLWFSILFNVRKI